MNTYYDDYQKRLEKIMKHLIVGYGYCGKFLAQELKHQGQEVLCWSRSIPSENGFAHQQIDISSDDFVIPQACETLYYLIPPPRAGKTDTLLARFLSKLNHLPKNFIYFGSSGVYGDHNGNWVNETTKLNLIHDRQYRRQHAENQLQQFSQDRDINISCLRIAGIYGPDRFPLQKIKDDKPIVNQQEAPYSNCIYVEDLVNTAWLLSHQSNGFEIFNVSDNHPNRMGYLQYKLAEIMGTKSPKEVSLQAYYDAATTMGKEFLSSSKKLNSDKIIQLLKSELNITNLELGLKKSISTSL